VVGCSEQRVHALQTLAVSCTALFMICPMLLSSQETMSTSENGLSPSSYWWTVALLIFDKHKRLAWASYLLGCARSNRIATACTCQLTADSRSRGKCTSQAQKNICARHCRNALKDALHICLAQRSAKVSFCQLSQQPEVRPITNRGAECRRS